jgi:hypothetical protein
MNEPIETASKATDQYKNNYLKSKIICEKVNGYLKKKDYLVKQGEDIVTTEFYFEDDKKIISNRMWRNYSIDCREFRREMFSFQIYKLKKIKNL